VRLNNKPIITYALENFSFQGIKEVVIVIGCLAQSFYKNLGKRYNVVFCKELLAKLLGNPKPNVCVIDTKNKLTGSVMKIKTSNKKIVAIDRNLKNANARAIGMYKFSSKGAQKFFDEIEILKRGAKKNFQIEAALVNFIKKSNLYFIKTNGLAWQEIDDTKDLEKASTMKNLYEKV
jgi:choline kinase